MLLHAAAHGLSFRSLAHVHGRMLLHCWFLLKAVLEVYLGCGANAVLACGLLSLCAV
jgi:hypothetical protein